MEQARSYELIAYTRACAKSRVSIYILYTLVANDRCTWLQTSISPPSMVASFAHLYTDHSLFHGPAPPLVTEVLLLQDRVCGTVCRPLFDRLPTMDSLSDIWSHIYLRPRNHGASWPWFFAPYKYTYLLTYFDFLTSKLFCQFLLTCEKNSALCLNVLCIFPYSS